MKVRAACLVPLLAILLAVLPTHADASGSQGPGMLGTAYRNDAAVAADRVVQTPNLAYHGGPILTQSTVHAVFWDPHDALTPTYKALMEQYFADVAHDSGLATNVYSVGTQYTDGQSNHADYNVVDGGSVTLRLPFPRQSSQCPIKRSLGYTACIWDSQIRHVIQKHTTGRGLNDIYFMFLPRHVDTCYSSRFCAHNVFCAYHSAFETPSGWVLYTNQPFAGIAGCEPLHSPNDVAADATLNVVSHEHNETITDPLGNAWFDRNGEENGDKCNFTFETPSGQDYNQTINGHNYELQEEWSNLTRGCEQHG